MKLTALFVASALVIAACGGSGSIDSDGSLPTTSTTSAIMSTATSAAMAPDSTGELMAVAFENLVVNDNTFGGPPPPFTDYLVQANLDPAAGDATGSTAIPGRALTDPERAAVTEALAPFGSVRWIDDPSNWQTDDLSPVVEGSVILGIGEPVISGDTALVPVSLWCGGLCGTWFIYGAVYTGGQWEITGIEGPMAIS